jgi:GNAT superfamily N-acetyltransferase
MIQVRPVQTPAEHEAFVRFPWLLYRDHPHWVPDLPSLRRDTLNKQKHAAWEYLEGDYFLAWDGNLPVGQIAAFINHRHNDYHQENIGFFGFFECQNDQRIANALFAAAEDYLRAKGVSAIRGPANFSTNETCGFLLEGFDQDPMVLMPYTPEYYLRLAEGAGYEKAMDLYSWKGTHQTVHGDMYDEHGAERKVVSVVKRNMERRHIHTRTIDMQHKQREFRILRSIYDKAWEKNWGFVPMTDRELDNLVRDLGFLLMPDYTFFAYVGDDPAGFMLLVPNFNEVLKQVMPHPGRPAAYWLPQVLWHWKARPKITSARGALMGVKEQYRAIGVDAALFLALGQQFLRDPQGLEWMEAGWTLEINEPVNRLLGNFGTHRHRSHRLYQKTL